MYLSIEIYQGNDNIYVAACPELNLFANAGTQTEAVEKLKANIFNLLKEEGEFAFSESDVKFDYQNVPPSETETVH